MDEVSIPAHFGSTDIGSVDRVIQFVWVDRRGTESPVDPGWTVTIFTSAWLWIDAASVLFSRVLLHMNDGVGFLLRVTDIENQPFRSIGFVSVLLVSALFAPGLPVVLIQPLRRERPQRLIERSGSRSHL